MTLLPTDYSDGYHRSESLWAILLVFVLFARVILVLIIKSKRCSQIIDGYFMYSFEKSIFINQPQKEVFDYATDPTRNAEWQSQTVSAEWASDGLPGTGSKIKSVVKLFGREITGGAEVTHWEPYHAFSFKGSGGGFNVEGKLRFEPKENGTQLTLNGQVHGVGIFKLFERMIGRQTEKMDNSNYENLKLLLEAI
jgi:carbon monoxide dehydrogenase subunit G